MSPAKKAAVVFITIFAILAAIYAAGVWFFSSHTFPNTKIGSTDVSLQETQKVQQQAADFASSYKLRLHNGTFDCTFTAAELGVSTNPLATSTTLFSGNAIVWPLELFVDHSISAENLIEIDYSTLAASVEAAVAEHNATATAPSEATLTFDETSKKVVFKASSYGTELDSAHVVAKAKAAVATGEQDVTLGQDDLVAPQTNSSETAMQKAAEEANKLCNYDITIDVGGAATVKIDNATAFDWLTISDSYAVSLDQSKVDAWIDSFVGAFNQEGGDRTFTRSDGKVCTVSGGSYGGWTTDTDEVRSQLTAAIAAGGTQTVSIACSSTGNGFWGYPGADWGKRYADVDISEQYTRFYDENGEIIWETDCITGWDNGYYDTPTGVYTIYNKESPSVLQSTGTETYINDDGEEEEKTVTYRHEVSYWMPFIGNFIGFHDATWQTAGWGGDLYHYQQYGSGGCVNLPLEMAESLYDIIEVGDVVVVHY